MICSESLILDESSYFQIWTSTLNTFIVAVLSYLMYDFNVRSQKIKKSHDNFLLYLEFIENIEKISKFNQTSINEELHYFDNREYSHIILLGDSFSILEDQRVFKDLVELLHKIEGFQKNHSDGFERSINSFVQQYLEDGQLKPRYESLIKKAFGVSERNNEL